jgi:hypothetical protein
MNDCGDPATLCAQDVQAWPGPYRTRAGGSGATPG